MQTLVFNKAGRQPNSQTLKQPQKLSKAGSSNEVPFLQRKKRRKDTTERTHGGWGERPAEIDFLQVKVMLSGTEKIPCFETQELRGPGAGTTWETTQSCYVRLTDAHLCWREREGVDDFTQDPQSQTAAASAERRLGTSSTQASCKQPVPETLTYLKRSYKNDIFTGYKDTTTTTKKIREETGKPKAD